VHWFGSLLAIVLHALLCGDMLLGVERAEAGSRSYINALHSLFTNCQWRSSVVYRDSGYGVRRNRGSAHAMRAAARMRRNHVAYDTKNENVEIMRLETRTRSNAP